MKSILDRTVPPIPKLFSNKPLPAFRKAALSNGIQVYLLQHGTVEVAEVQAVFQAGKSFQPKAGVASYTSRNLAEGTSSYNSKELAQKLDDHGAWISNDTANEFVSINLTTLEKHLDSTLPILSEVLMAPTFPEDEFEKMRFRSLQKLQVEAEKTAYVARREFGKLMIGENHPYGMHTGPEELKALTREDLVAYHRDFLLLDNAFFTVVGRFDEDKVLARLEGLFGGKSLRLGSPLQSAAENKAFSAQTGRRTFEKEGMQTSLRLGHLGFKRSHPDYYRMEMVNTILGGYFGSRLMKNIREEKGYTYGIYSGWVAHKHGGYLVVQSDVGNEYVSSAIEEVKKEMRKLMADGIGEEELELVKNYVVGKSISQRETPFQLGNILRFSIVNDTSFENLDSRYDIIGNMSTDEVVELANRYLKPDEMLEVVCGMPQ